MSEEEVKALQREVHALNERLEKGSWIAKNGSWLISLTTAIVVAMLWMFSLKGRIEVLEVTIEHHRKEPFHDGMSETREKLSEIKTELRYLRDDLNEVKKNLLSPQ